MESQVVFPGRNTFELEKCERPALGPHEIRGRTVVSLVSPGTELAWAAGGEFPLRPGYAAVFEVEEAGQEIDGIEAKSLYFCMGPHRSFQQVDHRFARPLPAGLKPEVAVIARLLGVSMTTLMTTAAKPGDAVLVSGAGPVGYLAAHIFQRCGYEVHVVEPDAARRRQAELSGLRSTYESMPGRDDRLSGKVALALDCSGHEGSVLEACRIVRPHAEVVLVGVPWRRQTEISAHEILEAVFGNFVVLRSGWEWKLPLLSSEFRWTELYEGYNNSAHSVFSGFELALKWLDEGRIPLRGLTRKFAPQDVEAVYGGLLRRDVREPFVIFDWSENGQGTGV